MDVLLESTSYTFSRHDEVKPTNALVLSRVIAITLGGMGAVHFGNTLSPGHVEHVNLVALAENDELFH
jgi:hypothetical protein